LDIDEANERDLQQRMKAGDEGAFDAVFRAHYPRLVRMAESIVRDRAPAEEIVQEVMLELWRRRGSLRLEQGFGAYLVRSTRNRALNHVRHQRIVDRELGAATIEAGEFPATDAETLGVELERAIREAIDALPERCREVFQMSREQGLKYTEIAGVLEISVKTVEKRMGQALSELRERLAPWLGGGAGGGKTPA
jgi:RNA polymerase sigma-70 factor, ECF subfamily